MQPVITRRTLLAGITTHTLLWPTWSLAQQQAPRFSFLVVSDTHLGRNDSDSAARQWERTAQQLDAARGDFVLHLGDIVDSGREAQYTVYRRTRERIRKPVHEIPGNHDSVAAFQRELRRDIDSHFDHQGVRFLLLNNSRRDSHNGFISEAQLAWLREHLGEAAQRRLFVVLCMHVPAHSNRHPDRGWHVQPRDGQTELYEALAHHRQRVLALFHGHFHNGVRGWDDHASLQEVCFPSALYNQDRRLAQQQAPGYYLAELRPGFVEVAFGARGLTLAYCVTGATERVERSCPLPQLDS